MEKFFKNAIEAFDFFKDTEVLYTKQYYEYCIHVIKKDKTYYLLCPEDGYIINDYPNYETAVVAANCYWRISKRNFTCD